MWEFGKSKAREFTDLSVERSLMRLWGGWISGGG